ncbi:methyltransferase domain-containing protein [Actinomadura algeriensis]|uniref:SAM-dependent methyltransferase n=1 Tax=Actinomadura algeriensis TaxID=1679523 RepID=A0ABR9JQN0_9ACTN|nr:methyltransferase domain-containing protein [Actinomadura algeriensis]MBE1532832.1 SAM-dependent methyltransferase [Actinomadura algeriensis]
MSAAVTAGVFGDHDADARERHRLLGAAFDPMTVRNLARTGVGPGARCLEVGAGNGTVSAWLERRAGTAGRVVATDVRPDPDAAGPPVVRHDIVRDPLPEAEYDLVHARLVLRLLPERDAVLARLVRALKPGGVLQLDEFDASDAPALRVPSPAARALYESFTAAKNRLMARAGVDVAWGRDVARAMDAAGLTGVASWTRVELWDARSPGLRLLAHHARHLHDGLVREGMSPERLDEVRALLADPRFRARSYTMYSVQGRRPLEVR